MIQCGGMHICKALLEWVQQTMKRQGFAIRDVPAPILVHDPRIDYPRYKAGVIYMHVDGSDHDLVHEIVHHYQANQITPKYHAQKGRRFVRAWTKDPLEIQARLIAAHYIYPELSWEEICAIVENQSIQMMTDSYDDTICHS